MLSQVKLIAEPWDVGPGGYQVGNFPVGWAEWNGKYRDCVRRFWRGDPGQLPELASRLSGSSDLYAGERAATPTRASTSSPRTTASRCRPRQLRAQAQRGERRGQPRRHRRQPAAATGARRARPTTPRRCARCASGCSATCSPRCSSRRACAMLLAGDEMGRTQRGNNNAYCQDNEISWVDWELRRDEPRPPRVHAHGDLRSSASNPVLRHRELLHGPAGLGRRRQGHHVVAAGRHRDDGGGLGRPRPHVARHAAARPRRPTRSTSAAGRSSATRCCC